MPRAKKSVTKIESDYMKQYDHHKEREKRKKQRLIRRLVLFSIVAAVAFSMLATYHIKQRTLNAEKQNEYEQLEEELADLEKEEANLKEEINLLNDEEYVLEIARTNYFFSKKGELIFKMPDEEGSY
ncbi:FtsB family cell division protein [Virgibacillus sp. W0181]|uniref:FtsB family cell division protein n=1 Tax=Virgibacillus sp. W0181 TaxID=3391581 RepID=UPI003F449C04